jgi:hypothetical protein
MVRDNDSASLSANDHSSQRDLDIVPAVGRRTGPPSTEGTGDTNGEGLPPGPGEEGHGRARSRGLTSRVLVVAATVAMLALAAAVPVAVHSKTSAERPVATHSGTRTSSGAQAPPDGDGQAHRGWAAVPPRLQVAIDRTLFAKPVSSPAGISLSWGHAGSVSFRAKGDAQSFGLRPVSVGRTTAETLNPGPFVFGGAGATETLGRGLSAWYKISRTGFEQGFTVAHRPAGAGNQFSIVLRSSGDLQVDDSGARGFVVASAFGPVMTYGSLRATDANGKPLPSHLSFK